ncbi:MAG: ParA family protein [Acidobacteria bacterium]|nr:ParA family protein [Acidobacteriota bacterium]
MEKKTTAGKIVAFVNQKGGVGKSILAINVSAMLSNKFSVLLLDTDNQGSSEDWGVARINKLESNNRLRGFSKHYRGIKRATEVSMDLQEIAASYDLVIVDTPGRNELVSLGVIAAANLVIIPLTPGNFSFWSSEITRELIQKVAAARPEDFAARLLLNMRDKRKKISQEAENMLQDLEIPVMKTSVGHRNIFESSSEGLSVLELPARSASDKEAQREMNELVSEIEEILGLQDEKTKSKKSATKKATKTVV